MDFFINTSDGEQKTIQQLTHILLTLIFAGLPLTFIVLKYHKIIFQNFRTIFLVLLITIGYSIVVDNIAIYMNIWNYRNGLFTGIRIPFMPIDDLIFISFVQVLISSVVIVGVKKKK